MRDSIDKFPCEACKVVNKAMAYAYEDRCLFVFLPVRAGYVVIRADGAPGELVQYSAVKIMGEARDVGTLVGWFGSADDLLHGVVTRSDFDETFVDATDSLYRVVVSVGVGTGSALLRDYKRIKIV